MKTPKSRSEMQSHPHGLPRFTLRPTTFAPNCIESPNLYSAPEYLFHFNRDIDSSKYFPNNSAFILPNTIAAEGRKRSIKDVTIFFAQPSAKRCFAMRGWICSKSKIVANGIRSNCLKRRFPFDRNRMRPSFAQILRPDNYSANPLRTKVDRDFEKNIYRIHAKSLCPMGLSPRKCPALRGKPKPRPMRLIIFPPFARCECHKAQAVRHGVPIGRKNP